ncbi:hypothetical protein Tco_1264817 [Tanacetum coccineum]
MSSVVGTIADITWGSDFVYLGVVSEQDEPPSSVELDFLSSIRRIECTPGHLEAMHFLIGLTKSLGSFQLLVIEDEVL